ncbi:hypothetical protein DF185_12825 [Marinifilum breve]|uniref:Uncharacterized protein n=1 Tax=Marinifilum breve TaxID=2184082 RepID=A0A2V3ZWZ6_9BACT|nr:hypothetical protein [Marinifilum breve]PXY00783.1 hypothetical protein DF185_12825 [Marinifilum breve]
MKKITRKLITLIAITIVLANLLSGIINLFTEGIGKGYTYETYDGKYKFTYVPSKGGKFERVKTYFEFLQEDDPHYKGTELFRTFERKPLQFWNWYSYMFSEAYSFQYRELSKGSVHYRGLEKQ